MFSGPAPLSILAAVLALGAIGLALALASVGVPFLLAAILAAAACGVVHFWALHRQPKPVPDRTRETALLAQLDEYQKATASLRHDLRGVMSPALMVSDRLLSHEDVGVQRAGQAVVRSVERATALLAEHREALADQPPGVESPGVQSPGAATPPPP